jgi:hypothetical protein
MNLIILIFMYVFIFYLFVYVFIFLFISSIITPKFVDLCIDSFKEMLFEHKASTSLVSII